MPALFVGMQVFGSAGWTLVERGRHPAGAAGLFAGRLRRHLRTAAAHGGRGAGVLDPAHGARAAGAAARRQGCLLDRPGGGDGGAGLRAPDRSLAASAGGAATPAAWARWSSRGRPRSPSSRSVWRPRWPICRTSAARRWASAPPICSCCVAGLFNVAILQPGPTACARCCSTCWPRPPPGARASRRARPAVRRRGDRPARPVSHHGGDRRRAAVPGRTGGRTLATAMEPPAATGRLCPGSPSWGPGCWSTGFGTTASAGLRRRAQRGARAAGGAGHSCCRGSVFCWWARGWRRRWVRGRRRPARPRAGGGGRRTRGAFRPASLARLDPRPGRSPGGVLVLRSGRVGVQRHAAVGVGCPAGGGARSGRGPDRPSVGRRCSRVGCWRPPRRWRRGWRALADPLDARQLSDVGGWFGATDRMFR